MKKIIALVFLLCLGGGYKAWCQVQNNYLEEASKISSIAKSYSNGTKLTFTIDADGVPHPNEAVQFKAILNRVLSISNLAPGSATTITSNTKTAPVKVKPGGISTGPVKQPISSASNNVQAQQPVAHNAVADSLRADSISKELNYVLFVANDTDLADYQKVMPHFPKHFYFLDKIQLYIANSSISGTTFSFNEGTIITGLTDLIIKRAKQELVDAYLNAWYVKLKNDTIIAPLIPRTLSVFNAFNEDNSISLAKYGDKWKSAFQEDLRNLPVQLQNEVYVAMLLSKAGVKNTFEITPVITGGDEIAYNLYLKQHLVNVLAGMAGKYQAEDTIGKVPVFKRLVVLADILLTAGGTMDKTNTTYTPAQITQLRNMDISSWQVLLRITYLRNNAALKYAFNNAADDVVFNSMVTDKNVSKFIGLFTQTNSIVTAYQGIISTNAANTDNELSFDNVRKMFDIAFSVVDNTEGYLQLFDPNACRDSTYADNVKPYFTYLSQIGQGVSTQQYGNALDGAIGIIHKVSSTKPSACQDGVAIAKSTTTAKADTGSKAAAKTNASSILQSINNLQIYGSFMVNILTAKTAADVESALDELIPQGDYKLKNAGNFTVSLSAYPGVFAGLEKVSKNQTAGNASSTAFSPGVYLPIGIDLNWGVHCSKNKNDNKYGSIGLLLQAVDLGAVLNYRVNNSDPSVSAAPNITFKQLLSPGAAVTWHFINSPLIVGAGVNYTPGLRDITQSNNTTYQANALRYGVFLAVDVTFFNFSVSKYKSKN